MAEYCAVEIFNLLKPSGGHFAANELSVLQKNNFGIPQKMTKVALGLIAVGTIITGYGDIFAIKLSQSLGI